MYASALLHQINFTLSHLPVTMMSFIHQFGVAMETLAGVVLVWPFCDTVCLFHNLERIEPSLPVRCSVVTPQSSASTWVVYVGGRHVGGILVQKLDSFRGKTPEALKDGVFYQPIIWDPLHSSCRVESHHPLLQKPIHTNRRLILTPPHWLFWSFQSPTNRPRSPLAAMSGCSG